MLHVSRLCVPPQDFHANTCRTFNWVKLRSAKHKQDLQVLGVVVQIRTIKVVQLVLWSEQRLVFGLWLTDSNKGANMPKKEKWSGTGVQKTNTLKVRQIKNIEKTKQNRKRMQNHHKQKDELSIARRKYYHRWLVFPKARRNRSPLLLYHSSYAFMLCPEEWTGFAPMLPELSAPFMSLHSIHFEYWQATGLLHCSGSV